MTDQFVVLGFLDIFGDWNPRLAFLLGGAFRVPAGDVLDERLLLDAAIFGVGWGLAGFCSGQVLVGAAAGLRDA